MNDQDVMHAAILIELDRQLLFGMDPDASIRTAEDCLREAKVLTKEAIGCNMKPSLTRLRGKMVEQVNLLKRRIENARIQECSE